MAPIGRYSEHIFSVRYGEFCGGDMEPSVGSRPTRRVVCCRGALDNVSLGLDNPPRCPMGAKKFCARSAVSQHTVLGYCTPQYHRMPI
jgi:hypothetical protein